MAFVFPWSLAYGEDSSTTSTSSEVSQQSTHTHESSEEKKESEKTIQETKESRVEENVASKETEEKNTASADGIIKPMAWADLDNELKVQLLYPDGTPARNVQYSFVLSEGMGLDVPYSGYTSNIDGTFIIQYNLDSNFNKFQAWGITEMRFADKGFKKIYADPQDPTRKIQQTYLSINSRPSTPENIQTVDYDTWTFRDMFDYMGSKQTIVNGKIVLPAKGTGDGGGGLTAAFAGATVIPNGATTVKQRIKTGTEPYMLYYQGIGIMEKYVDTNGNLLQEAPTPDKVENFINRGETGEYGKTGLKKSFKDSSDQVWLLDKVKHSKSHKYNDSTAVEITPDFDENPQFTINTNTDFEYLFYAYKKGFRVTEEFVPTENLNAKLEADKYHDMEENQKYEVTKKPADITYYGNVWEFDYWTLDGGSTKNYNMPVTINNVTKNETIKYVYKRSTKAIGTMTLEPDKKTVSNNDTVNWTAKVNNTHTTNVLKTMKLKADSSWSAGLKDPVNVSITPDGGVTSNFTVNPGDWATGVDLTNIEIPAKKSAEIKFSTQATGTTNEVLSAKIKLSGNLANDLEAENVVRIDDEDEPNTNPSGDVGILNVPMFGFQPAAVKNTNATYKLAEDDYQNQGPQPKNAPYVRFKTLDTSKTQWKLNAQLAQFQSTSSVETLSTLTTIALKDVQQAEVLNYNKPSESLSAYGSPFNLTIPSDSSPVPIANGTQNGVYQLKIPFESVEIQIPANQGVVGEKFHSVLTWSLDVTP